LARRTRTGTRLTAGRPQREGDGEDDEAHRAERRSRALEHRGPVPEAQLVRSEHALLARDAVEDEDLAEAVGDLCAVRTHVLDGGGAHGAGYPGQRLQAGQAALHGLGDEIVPVLARLCRHPHGAVGIRVLPVDPAGPDEADGAVEALVRDEQVGAARHEQDIRRGERRRAFPAIGQRVGACEVHELPAGAGLVRVGDGAAHPQGREVCEPHARRTFTWVRPRTESSPALTARSRRTTPASASIAPTVAVSASWAVGAVGGPDSASGTTTIDVKRVRASSTEPGSPVQSVTRATTEPSVSMPCAMTLGRPTS